MSIPTSATRNLNSYCDQPYVAAASAMSKQTIPDVDCMDHLLQKMQISSSPDIDSSIDELANTLKEHFSLQSKEANIRDLAKFVMKLNLRNSTQPTKSGNTKNDFSSISPSRGSKTYAPSSFNKFSVSDSQSDLQDSSPLIYPPNPIKSDVCSKDFKIIPPFDLPPLPTTPPITTVGDDAFSPPSTAGTFNSDSADSNLDIPILNVDDTKATTPATVEIPVEETSNTGQAKRRNKVETAPSELKSNVQPHQNTFTLPPQQTYQPPSEVAFQQAIRSPPQFKVNMKKSKCQKKIGGVGGIGVLRLRRPPSRFGSCHVSHQSATPSAVPSNIPNNCQTESQNLNSNQQQTSFVKESSAPSQIFTALPTGYDKTQSTSNLSSSQPQMEFFQTQPEIVDQAIVRERTVLNDTFVFSTESPSDSNAGTPMSSFSPMDLEVKFNIGSSSGSRSRRSVMKKVSSPRNRRGFGGPEQARNLEARACLFPDFNETFNNVKADKGKAKEKIDYSGRNAMVDALRKEARELYSAGEYCLSVNKYSLALETHNGISSFEKPDDRRAVLLANRAAGLLMLGAYGASINDCIEASKYVEDLESCSLLTSEGGPLLKAKIFTRMGRAMVKRGDLDHASESFDKALDVLERTIEIMIVVPEENKMQLTQLRIDAAAGKTEITRCREAIDTMKSLGLTRPADVLVASRRINLRGLSNVKLALNFSPGCQDLLAMRLAILASLHRWRELYLCCENLASETAKFDGLFTYDLKLQDPFPNVPSAKYLKTGTSELSEPGKLSSKAVAEATLRLLPAFQPYYIRALRLEERCPAALHAVNVLCDFVNTFLSGSDLLKFGWIVTEKHKLDRTISSKDKGDALFRTGDYKGAIDHYTLCLKVDSENSATANEGEAGGRLHAVLHCNRAAAYMALLKYRDAIADCSAALHIHSQYMKALLRRSRCYVRLNRFDEAQAEYERYINLVELARVKGCNPDSTTACFFDGPYDVSDSDLSAVQDELKEVKRAKLNSEKIRQREEAARMNRQNWYHDSFGNSRNPSDAEKRRQDWYSQQGKSSRRWDSFNGKFPNSNGHGSHHGDQSKNAGASTRRNNRSYRDEYFDSHQKQRSKCHEERKENVFGVSESESSICHYKVLQINQAATDAEVKRAYKMAALKYHPDKNQEPGATDMFRRIKLAYDILKDPVQRRDYDTQIRWNQRT
jgi:tetratricopeptide (TPR) repeat protein